MNQTNIDNATQNDPRSRVERPFFYMLGLGDPISDFTSDPSTKERLDGLIAKP